MPPPFPPLPPEAPFTDAEFNFRDAEPRRIFPENQDSNYGLIRKIFTDQLDDIYQKLHLIWTEMFPQSSVEFLDEWERMVGLPRNPADRTVAQRRALIMARLQQGPFTRLRRWNIVNEFITATFGDAIRLYPAGVALVPEGVPIYNDTPPGEYFRIEEIVGTFYYEVQIINSLTGINESGLTNALTWVQYGGLHYRVRYVPSVIPADAYTALLIHCDGTDASTVFIDQSPSPKAITAVGSAQIDTAQYKFGGASALFDGSGTAIITTPDSPDLEFGSGDFTIEFWIRFSSLAVATWVAHKSNGTSGAYGFYQSGGNMSFYASANAGSWDLANAWSCGSFVINQWYHVAVTRQGNTFRTFKDGVVQATNTSSASVLNTTDAHRFGGFGSGASIVGWMDEIRISKGIARWTANFTPPTTFYDSVTVPSDPGL